MNPRLLCLLAFLGAVRPALADYAVPLDELIILRDGGAYYADLFDDGVAPPSGGAFAGGGDGTYTVRGIFPAGSEVGGQLNLATVNGEFTANAISQPRVGQTLTLQTGIDPADPATGLNSSHTFSVTAKYGLLPPGALDIAGTYSVYLTDASTTQAASDSLQIWVNRANDGVERVRFVRQDFAAGQLTILGSLNLDRTGSPDQIELQLSRPTLADNTVIAGIRYWKAGSPLTTDFIAIPVSPSADTTIFNGESFTRAGFFATTAGRTDVPTSYVRNVSIGGSGTFTVAPDTYTQPSGSTIVNGTFTAGSPADVAIRLDGGLLGGTGTIVGAVIQTGGTVNPGNSPGTLTIDGDYTVSGGTLVIELASGASFDQLLVSGTATLGGVLNLVALDGYRPALGATFALLVAGGVSGAFDSVALTNLDGYQFALSYADGVTAQVVAVPEPSTCAMLLAGLGLVGMMARRRLPRAA